jgi:hypothetical protein
VNSDALAKQIESLSDESRQAVLKLLNDLAKRAADAPRHVFKFDWEGGLSESFNGVSSVDLQHEAAKWR